MPVSFARKTPTRRGGYIPAQCMGFHELRLQCGGVTVRI